MRVVLSLSVLATVAVGLQPGALTRRRVAEIVATGTLAPVLAPFVAVAQQQETPESIESTGVGAERNFLKEGREPPQPQQWAPPGKLDVNAATVNEYTQFPGLYPRVAGKIASGGPYQSVKDVYKNLDGRDSRAFRKYESNFVALPPGRQFIERINQRQSL